MTRQLTETSLGIFWNGEEVDGITVYGFFRGEKVDAPELDEVIWNENIEVKTSKLFGDKWTVWVWDIRICGWPDTANWFHVVKATLKEMLSHGAVVSWAGLEGFFVEPPDLFDPQYMSDGVWAVLSESEEFICSAEIGQPFKTLDDQVLEHMRKLGLT